MIIVTQNRKEYEIYESLTEIENKGLVYYKKLAEISDGDYIQTNNGLYVPLIFKREYLRRYYHHNGQKHLRHTPIKSFFYIFPRQKLVVTENGINRSFSYAAHINCIDINPCGSVGKKSKVIKPEYRFFAECIKHGMSLLESIKATYPKLKRSNQITMKLHTVLNQHQVIKSIFREDYMKSIREELLEQGLDNGTIAQEIACLVRDKKANPTLRKWALEQSMNILKEGKEVNNIIKQASMGLTNHLNDFHIS